MLVTYGGSFAATTGGADDPGSVRKTGRRDPFPNPKKQELKEEPSVKFLMLNPSVHFDEIVKKVRDDDCILYV